MEVYTLLPGKETLTGGIERVGRFPDRRDNADTVVTISGG